MTKPTEGPYRLWISSDARDHTITGGDPPRFIAAVINYDGTPRADRMQDQANARLLAASWEMREALKQIVSWKEPIALIAPELGGTLKAIYHAEALLARIDGDTE